MSNANPFKGRTTSLPPPMRVIHRFSKPGHWAEIRERTVTAFRAIEYLVFIDGALLESQLFHHGREAAYPTELDARIKQFTEGGWVEERREAPDVPPLS